MRSCCWLFLATLLTFCVTLVGIGSMSGRLTRRKRHGEESEHTEQRLRRSVANLSRIVDCILSLTIPAGGFY
jgi:C4-dicarboxylate-specific signal transduction histidine kinase